eukprot:2390366-Amphidinium_carterae.1
MTTISLAEACRCAVDMHDPNVNKRKKETDETPITLYLTLGGPSSNSEQLVQSHASGSVEDTLRLRDLHCSRPCRGSAAATSKKVSDQSWKAVRRPRTLSSTYSSIWFRVLSR